jgi:hypothetical protein
MGLLVAGTDSEACWEGWWSPSGQTTYRLPDTDHAGRAPDGNRHLKFDKTWDNFLGDKQRWDP